LVLGAQGYIRHTHEQAIISAIEEGRRATTADFYRNLDTKMRRDWEKQKDKLFEELGRHQPAAGPSTESTSSSSSRRGNSFERAVSRRSRACFSPSGLS
jgi:nuclear pore complex protein Nup93